MSSEQATLESVNAMMEKLLQQQTFSAQAVEGITKQREENNALKLRVLALEKDIEARRLAFDDVKTENARLQARIKEFEAQEKAVREREAKAASNETATAVAQAESKTFEKCVTLIFRNTQMRETIFSREPLPTVSSANPNQYIQQHNGNGDGTISTSKDRTQGAE
jgi:hypothetical protein